MHSRRRGFALVAAALLSLAGVETLVAGTDEDYVMSISSTVAAADDEATVEVNFDVFGSDAISGWSFGMCNDDLVTIGVGDVANGSTTNTVNDGDEPDFQGISFPAGGWTVGAIVSLTGGASLPPGEEMQMYLATYTTLSTLGDSALEICDGIGTPPISVIMVKEVGGEVEPVRNGGVITIAELSPFFFILPSTSVDYRPENGLAGVTVAPTIVEDPESKTFPSATQGFSMAIEHDTEVMTPLSLEATGPLLDLNGGSGPEYFGVNLDASDRGVTVGVVYVFLAAETIEFATETAVVEIEYEADSAVLIGNETGVNSTLEFVETLGAPVVRNRVVVGGFSQDVRMTNGSVAFVPILVSPFARGDCNDDGDIQLADPIFLLTFLFKAGPSRNCAAACDMNHDGDVNLADPIFLLAYLFTSGPDLDEPFPECGSTTDLDEDCEEHESCAP